MSAFTGPGFYPDIAAVHASMPHPRSVSTTGVPAEAPPTITILGVEIPRSAVTDKAGSVSATLLVHTLYPSLVTLLVSYAIFHDLQHVVDAQRLSPTVLNTFAGISIGCAIMWPVQYCLAILAPSGMPFFLYIRARFLLSFSCTCVAAAAAPVP